MNNVEIGSTIINHATGDYLEVVNVWSDSVFAKYSSGIFAQLYEKEFSVVYDKVEVFEDIGNPVEHLAEELPLAIGFKKLSGNAILPTKANPTDSGLDLYAAEDVIIAPGETVLIATDLAVELPKGYEAQVRPRSGITAKTKLRVQLGTIDNAYRGNIKIIVDNVSQYVFGKEYERVSIQHKADSVNFDHLCYEIKKGDKIAQLVVQEIPKTIAYEIEEVGESDRGENGFGSSGV